MAFCKGNPLEHCWDTGKSILTPKCHFRKTHIILLRAETCFIRMGKGKKSSAHCCSRDIWCLVSLSLENYIWTNLYWHDKSQLVKDNCKDKTLRNKSSKQQSRQMQHYTTGRNKNHLCTDEFCANPVKV